MSDSCLTADWCVPASPPAASAAADQCQRFDEASHLDDSSIGSPFLYTDDASTSSDQHYSALVDQSPDGSAPLSDHDDSIWPSTNPSTSSNVREEVERGVYPISARHSQPLRCVDAFIVPPDSKQQSSPLSLKLPTASFPSASCEKRYREVVKQKHRQVDQRRRKREAACMARLATLVSLSSTTSIPTTTSSNADTDNNTGAASELDRSAQSSKRRALDKVATLETVANRIQDLLQRVAELEQQRSSSEGMQQQEARQRERAVFAWPVVDTPGAHRPLSTNSLSLNGSLVQGSVKALCVHAGTGQTVDCTSLAKLCMTGSVDCSLEQLTSPSWAACQRMLAPAAARGEESPFFYYSADQSSPVDFIGPPDDPGLTFWLGELYQLLTRRKRSIEGTKLFKLSDGQWHASTSRLWLLDSGSLDKLEQQSDGSEAAVDWDSLVMVLSLSHHQPVATAEECERTDSLDWDEASSQISQWRQWPSFSPA